MVVVWQFRSVHFLLSCGDCELTAILKHFLQLATLEIASAEIWPSMWLWIRPCMDGIYEGGAPGKAYKSSKFIFYVRKPKGVACETNLRS